MFYQCETSYIYNINELDVKDIFNAKNISYMFADCEVNNNPSTRPTLASWNTGNVTTMKGLFKSSFLCDGIRNWDLKKTTDISYIFSGAENILGDQVDKNLFSDWNTQNILNIL